MTTAAYLTELTAPVFAEMSRYLPDREPREYLYDLVAEYPRRDAKGLRPAIMIACCEAHGGHRSMALLPAASLELLHNALLVHDDIQDASELRRGLPTLHRIAGEPLALNAGSALAMFALRALHRGVEGLGSRVGQLLVAEFHRMARYSLEGQALELGWTRDNVIDLDDADYLRLVMKKTCWYTTVYPLRVGATIATRGLAPLEPLLRFGYFLGAAFQIQDDLLNLGGDEAIYGKEVLGDLLEGKRTLPLIHLLRSSTGTKRERVVEILGTARQRRTVEDARWMRDEMERAGSIAYTRAFAEGIGAEARATFREAFDPLPPTDGKRFLAELIAYMLDRSR